MSKRAGAVPEETRASLIGAATEEFAEYGYRNSSLRRICAGAGVTTGALYFFFRDKDDIFRAVMDTVTVPFLEIIKRHYEDEDVKTDESSKEAESDDLEATLLSIRFYCAHRKEFGILLSHRDQPAVRKFFSDFTEVSVEHYVKTLASKGLSAERYSLEMFVHMQLDLMLGLAEKDLEEEEMLKRAETATLMLRGAFGALLSEN